MASDDDDDKLTSLDDLSDLSSTNSSDDENDNKQSKDTGSEEPLQVEWLVTSRAKRSTAGNRMKSVLANEIPADSDSDLELLFAEDEKDTVFSLDEAQENTSDEQMDSSSDDEDQEDNGDELAGEKELEREARAQRMSQRKRKAQEAIPAKFRKKVRIEQPERPPRPKKKSERTSWLPSPADMPTRSSERQTTKLSKQLLHQKMLEDEMRRKKMLERMEKKAKMLESQKKRPMTQAERLAEAAIVEKKNAKSLNRWAELEKQREEERMKKIAALNSRKLSGPVITFWSGIQEIQEGQAKHIGNLVSMEEKAPRRKRPSVAAALAAKEAQEAPTPEQRPEAGEQPAVKAENADIPATPIEAPVVPPLASALAPPSASGPASAPVPGSAPAPGQAPTPSPPVPSLAPPVPAPAPTHTPMAPPPIPPPPDVRPGSSGVLVAPVLAPPAGVTAPMPGGKSNILAPPNTSQTPLPLQMPGAAAPVAAPATPASLAPPQATAPALTPLAPTPKPPATLPLPPLPSTSATAQPEAQPPSAKPADQPQVGAQAPGQEPGVATTTPGDPAVGTKFTRSCIILQGFDDTAIKDKQVQTRIIFGRTMNKLAKPEQPLCVITNRPAKYRDPKTGLPYANAYAYRQIQRALRGDFKFSALLGCYVGRCDYAAAGAPDWFVDPSPNAPHKAAAPTALATETPVAAEKGQEPMLVKIDEGEGDAKKGGEEGQQPELQGKSIVDEPRLVPGDLVGESGQQQGVGGAGPPGPGLAGPAPVAGQPVAAAAAISNV